MTEITHGHADLGHIKLHYAESGSHKDDLVIFLHGFPEFWYTWRKQLPVIGEHFHAVAPDMRGYNLSDRPENLEDYRIDKLVTDVIKLGAHFGKDKFYLVSHDWGAAVAFSVAIARPDLIKGLIVLNGAHPYIFSKLLEENENQIAHSKYITEFREEDAPERLAQDNCEWLWDWTFKDHYDRGLITDAEKAEYIKAWTRPGAITAMLNYYRASPIKPRPASQGAKPLNLDPEKYKVHVPTLIVWGDKDHALMPENLEGMGDFIDDLEVVRLPEVSHWVTHEDPERVSTEVLRYIKQLKGRKLG